MGLGYGPTGVEFESDLWRGFLDEQFECGFAADINDLVTVIVIE